MLERNLVQTYQDSLNKNKEHPAFTDYNGGSYTYREAGDWIRKLHAIYKAAGIKKGDKIALLGKNSANWGIIYLATISYGAVIVPILPDFTPEDMGHIIDHSDSVLLFVGDILWPPLEAFKLKKLRGIFFIQDFKLVEDRYKKRIEKVLDDLDTQAEMQFGKEAELNFPEIGNEELAVISYTSGTTGFSKGVMLSHNSLMANIQFAQEHMPLEPKDDIVSFLPLAHAYGCAFEFLFPVTLGCHITFLTKTPSPQIITRAFREIRPRLILSVPLVIEKIYKKRILPALNKPTIKFMMKVPLLNRVVYKKVYKQVFNTFGGNFVELVIGGAALSPEAEDFFRKIGLHFTVGYGMTECGPLISYASWDTTKPRSAGKLVDTLELKIDSPDPYKEVGEIMVRGENVMEGYYKNEEATKAVLDEDGWFHTGDLGLTDKDQFIFIRGRSKSMLLGPSGQNIYPEEIEARLNNLPLVSESVVVQREQKLVALVHPDEEVMKAEGLNKEDLREKFAEYRFDINRSLATYMTLSDIQLHEEEFVKTPKRSIKRFLYQ